MSHEQQPADPFWNDDWEQCEVYFRHHPRLVRVRSHIDEERFLGRGSETLFSLREREGLRRMMWIRFFRFESDDPGPAWCLFSAAPQIRARD